MLLATCGYLYLATSSCQNQLYNLASMNHPHCYVYRQLVIIAIHVRHAIYVEMLQLYKTTLMYGQLQCSTAKNSSANYMTTDKNTQPYTKGPTVQSAAWPYKRAYQSPLQSPSLTTHTVLSCCSSTGQLPPATPVQRRTKWPPEINARQRYLHVAGGATSVVGEATNVDSGAD